MLGLPKRAGKGKKYLPTPYSSNQPHPPVSQQQSQEPVESVDLSATKTTVAFESVIPPLRVPLPARPDEDPDKGRWVLAFRDEVSWRQAWLKCEANLAQQCQLGARMGCSITATNNCRVPWWKSILTYLKIVREVEGERERCEEKEMGGCMIAAEESCLEYAKKTCEPVFATTRIAKPGQVIDPVFVTR